MSLSREKLWKAVISGICLRALFPRSGIWIERPVSRHDSTRTHPPKTFRTPIIRHARPQCSKAAESKLHRFHAASAKNRKVLFLGSILNKYAARQFEIDNCQIGWTMDLSQQHFPKILVWTAILGGWHAACAY